MEAYMKRNIKEIERIENKYDLIIFRMAIIHLFDMGVRHFTDITIVEYLKQIDIQEKKDIENDVERIMITPTVERAIINCCAELATISIWDLLHYIKLYVNC
jgi:hypothetical protein